MREGWLLASQTFNVAFWLLHDWVPLGSLNNLAAVREHNTLGHRMVVTLLGGFPAAVCLFLSAEHVGQPYPQAVQLWLWLTYGLLLAGLLRAWWIPYLLLPDPRRAERYGELFRGTHSFLPRRNGIMPDTLHVCFHANVIVTLLFLLLRSRAGA